MKTCSACRSDLPLTEFATDRRSKDGLFGKCRSCQSAYFRKHYQANKTSIRKKNAEYAKANPEVQRTAKKNWQSKNREKHLKSRRKRHAERYAGCDTYRLNVLVRTYLRRASDIAKARGLSLSKNRLGYSAEDLRARIEINFKPGMSWGNHGEWHIDHRVPVSRLIDRGINDPAVINCLSNLVPLWASENLKKGAR